MDSSNNKIFFIEYYNLTDNSLLNKFKFTFEVKKIKELKTLITEKLLAKNQIEPTASLILRDIDDFELDSEDEVSTVIPDGKIKLYRKDKIATIAPLLPSIVSPPVNPVSSVTSSAVILPNLTELISNPILNLTNFAVPPIKPEAKTMNLYCLQIRKTPIPIEIFTNELTYYEFSSYILKILGLDPSLKTIIYNHYGHPLLFNLDLMHQMLPILDLTRSFYAVFTRSPSTVDTLIIPPKEISLKIETITVTFKEKKYTLPIDLDNTLEVLKYRVFKMTKIHPLNQIIKFGGKIFNNNIEILKTLGLSDGTILELNFKIISNLNPASFADKFYYKDIEHVRKQDQLQTLRANLFVFASHLSDEDKKIFPYCIRFLTSDIPLVLAFKALFKNVFLSQAHRIALEEGLFNAIVEYLRQTKPELTKLEFKDVFSYVRDFLGFVLECVSNVKDWKLIEKNEEVIEINRVCYFTLKEIKSPRLVVLDSGDKVVVDHEQFTEQILKGFTYDLLKEPKKEKIIDVSDIHEAYELLWSNSIDNPVLNTVQYVAANATVVAMKVPVIEEYSKYTNKIDNYPLMKIYTPLEIKNIHRSYILLKMKNNDLMVYVSNNKDVNKPYNIFNVITGEETAVNLDLLGANVKTENVEEAIDTNNIKAVITREPKEAIVVLFDISGSMSGKFFNETDLNRIGAVKSFFEAFAFRTIAYNFEHAVSLIFFDNRLEKNCGFTEAIYDFNRLIAKATPRGSTLLYDAIVTAVNDLVEFKKLYPNCLLRIVALTDGEDTGSVHSIEETARAVVQNKITMDSFAVGTNCDGLKIVTKATGGKCYLTRSLEESLRLFEQETVLSVRARKDISVLQNLPIEKLIELGKQQSFDLASNVHEFKTAEISKPSLSAKDAIKNMQSEGEMKKMAGNAALKRISKEIQHYFDNPHPFIAIFPCSNINIWKVLLLGPKETPYHNGLFLLYIQFPGDYPFKSPEVRFTTPIYHCNMNSQGRICHSIFDRNYSPAISIRQIMDCVYGLVLTPEPEDPLDNVVASFFLSDYPTYHANAVKMTKEKASLTTEKIVEELFGKLPDDIERKRRENEIEDWVNTAKSLN